jgi:hypothetical protein
MGLFSRRSKWVALVLVVVSASIVLLNVENNDTVLYLGWYSEIQYAPFSRDWLFDALEYVFSIGGVPYGLYRLSLSIGALVLYYFGMYRISDGVKTLPMACFLLIPLWLGTTLFRTFLAGAVVCFALSFLFKEKSTQRDLLAYVVLVVVAGSIHFMSYYFLVLLLARLSKKTVASISIGITVLVLFSMFSGVASWALSHLVGSYRVEYYLKLNIGLGSLVFIASVLLLQLTCNEIGKSIDKHHACDTKMKNAISNTGLCFLPLCAVAVLNVSEIYRFLWILLPAIACLLARYCFSEEGLLGSRASLVCGAIVWIVAMLVLAFTVHDFNLSFIPVMTNNPINSLF